MKKTKKMMIWTSLSLSVMMLASALTPQMVNARDNTTEKPFLALGKDLKASEEEKVLELLGIKGNNLDDYEVIRIDNDDEHEYLDDYLSSSVIGSRALSSVLIEKTEEGEGIHVTTKNITYCTAGMYENALSTAGIEDADVVVAGPFEITGTAALVGAMKAYEEMTGDSIDDVSKDAATNELVVTGILADTIDDSEKAEQFIAMVKEEVLKEGLTDDSAITQAIEECQEELNISISEEEKEQIIQLMKKITSLDLNVDEMKQQAQDIYQQVTDFKKEHEGLFQAFMDFIKKIIESIS